MWNSVQPYYFPEDHEDSDQEDPDDDSNDENNWRNDYPDTEEDEEWYVSYKYNVIFFKEVFSI